MSTTIRVSAATRDRLNGLAEEFGMHNVDAVIGFLIDEQWRSQCVAQADEWTENRPSEVRRDRNTSWLMDELWSPALEGGAA
jgi:hypothetical protein